MKNKILGAVDKSYLSIITLTVALYLGFSNLVNGIETEVAREVINAAIGVIFVIMTTIFMLNKQTEVERKRDFDGEILKKKLATYENALAVWQRVGLTDGRIKQSDRADCLEIQLHIIMVAPKNVVESAAGVTKQVNLAYSSDDNDGIPDEDKAEFFEALANFSEVARKDLDLPETSLGMGPDFIKDMVTVVVEAATQNNKNYDGFIFDGKELKKSRLALEIVRKVASDRKVQSFEKLLELFPDILHTNGKNSSSINGRVVMPLEEAEALELRYHRKAEDVIHLGDGNCAVVSNQWGTNVDYFIKEVQKSLGVEIRRVVKQ